MKKIILFIFIFSSISIACVNIDSCKADLKECKNIYTSHIDKVFSCIQNSTTKLDLKKCENIEKDIFKNKNISK